MIAFAFQSARVLQTVIGSMNDSWDYLRSRAALCLMRFPTPLPGFTEKAEILPVVKWAKSLVNSPRYTCCLLLEEISRVIAVQT